MTTLILLSYHLNASSNPAAEFHSSMILIRSYGTGPRHAIPSSLTIDLLYILLHLVNAKHSLETSLSKLYGLETNLHSVKPNCIEQDVY